MDVEKVINEQSIFTRSSAFYRRLLEQSEDAMLLIKGNKFVYCNLATLGMLKFDNKAQVYTAHPADISPTRQPCGQLSSDKAEVLLEKTYQKGTHRFEWMHRNKFGEDFPVEVSLTKFQHLNDDYIHVVWRDITHRQERDQALEVLGLIYNQSNDAIMVTNGQNHIVDVNPAFEKITGYSKREVLGKEAGFMKSGRHDRVFYQNMWRTINCSGKWQGQIWDRHKQGHLLPKDLKITALKNKSGQVHRYIAVFSDCTARIKYEEELEKLAYYDSLTRFPNRALLLNKLQSKISQFSQAGKSASFYVAFIDLDDFKVINDTRGHIFGDEILKNAISLIAELIDEKDIIGRMSGDEFLIIFNSSHSKTSINVLFEEIYRKISSPVKVGNEEYSIKLSVGISQYPQNGHSTKLLISNADIAMYRAKKSGGNQFVYYNDRLGDSFHQYHKIGAELDNAIKHEKLFSHYQPLVDLETGEVIGCEALARWLNSDNTFIPPNVFIPMAEKSNQISVLSKHLFRQNCKFINRASKKLKASINISVQELSCPQFVTDFIDTIHRYGLSTSQIVIEITESNLIKNFTRVQSALSGLRKVGVKVAIDDFGTGFSSLSYLTRLSVDIVKLDKSFLDNIESYEGTTVLASIIGLAHNLGLIVVAEGVETELQYQKLRALNCDIAQGYYISAPLNEDNFTRFVCQTTNDRV